MTKSYKETLIHLAEYFKNATPPDAVIATHDIGALGYLSERRINDLVGLVNPRVLSFYRQDGGISSIPLNKRHLVPYIKRTSDFLVVFKFWEKFLNLSPDTLTNDFIFLGETKPIFGLNERYRIYGIIK